jgi:G:T-mismatch repair DNA endonuclease (very short patch repair protein)
MGETNGQSESRLDRLEASHIKLMTEHEVFWSHHREFVAEQERAWARHEAWLRDYDERCESDRQERKALENRMADLIIGIGEFIRRGDVRS